VLNGSSNVPEVRLYDAAGTQVLRIVCSAGFASTTTYYLGAATDGQNCHLTLWSAAGAELGTASGAAASANVLGANNYYLGCRPDGAIPATTLKADQALGWDGAYKSKAQLAAVVASLVAGDPPATAGADADMASRGTVAGGIDGTNSTALAYIGAEGDGTPVQVVAVAA
jgi:hypothetical protein